MGINDTVMQHVAKIENFTRQLNEVGELLSDVAINEDSNDTSRKIQPSDHRLGQRCCGDPYEFD